MSSMINFKELHLKDTHREKASSNKTPALMKSMNMDIWGVDTPNPTEIIKQPLNSNKIFTKIK